MRTLRPVTAEELPAYMAQAALAFHGTPAPDELVRAAATFVELDRTLGVFEDGQLVGTAGIETFQLTVPGGRVQAAGIGRVTVLPTHRRRGILNDIVRRQVRDIRERDEPVAMLYTSEGGIYGRYGFGVATYENHVRVARHRNAFRTPVSTAGLRLVPLTDALDMVTSIVAAVTEDLPGGIQRSDAWWRFVAEAPRPSPLEVVVRAEDDGFAIYERSLELSLPTLDGGSLRVRGLFASGPEAHAALWRYCLDIDLMEEVVAGDRPVDEPMRHLLADPRALESRVWDGLWLRLVDVQAALGARAYADAGGVRLAVADAFCPWNAGTYEVDGDGCRRVAAEPDLALAVDALAACYLGGNRFTTLQRAGLVDELVPGAALRADALFAAPRPPWCPFHF